MGNRGACPGDTGFDCSESNFLTKQGILKKIRTSARSIMKLEVLLRRPKPGYSQVVPCGIKVMFHGSSDTRGGVVFRKFKRVAEKSG
jgi:hypothetical protein